MLTKKEINCIAIIVAYNPSVGFVNRCLDTLYQFGALVIIDNASDVSNLEYMRRFTDVSGIHVITNVCNMGLGFALNQGVQFAIERDYEYVCTLDQDSKLSSAFASTMFAAISASKQAKIPLAFLSPIYEDEMSGHRTSYGLRPSEIKGCMMATVTITSGNVVPIKTFLDIGYFDSDLFIDYLDYDFSLRCRRQGLVILEVVNAVLLHNLGCSESRSLFGKSYFVTHHTAERRYYITRNRIIVLVRHSFYSPVMAIKEFVRIVLDFWKVVFFESDRKSKLLAMRDGFVGAVTGVRGPRIAKKEINS